MGKNNKKLEDSKNTKNQKMNAKNVSKGKSAKGNKQIKHGGKGKLGKPGNYKMPPKADGFPPKQGDELPGAPEPTKQDPYWYAADENAIKDFASLPFVDVSGSQILNTDTSNLAAVVIPFVPTIPGTKGSNYATRAADAYYQSVSQGFSANFDFEAPDLIMTAIASADLFAFILEGARAYGLLNYYLQSNSLWPDRIIRAMGFDPSNMRANRREFVSQYNLRVNQINKIIAVPKSFFIGERWAYLSSAAFAEGDFGDYTTLFGYKHAKVMVYDGTTLTTGTCITYRDVPSSLFTVDSFFSFVDSLIESLIGDDQRQMFGAIRRVYDPSELMALATIDDSLTTTLTVNSVQSIQLHNTTFLPGFTGVALEGAEDGYHYGVACYQRSNGAIVSNYYATGDFAIGTTDGRQTKFIKRDRILLSMAGLPHTAGNVLDITANMIAFGEFHDNVDFPQTAQEISCRSEVCLLPRFVLTRNGTVYDNYMPRMYEDVTNEIQPEALAILSRMNRAPFVLYLRGVDGEEHGSEVVDYIGELDVYTTVSNAYLVNLHNKCAYKMLSLPESKKSVTK